MEKAPPSLACLLSMMSLLISGVKDELSFIAQLIIFIPRCTLKKQHKKEKDPFFGSIFNVYTTLAPRVFSISLRANSWASELNDAAPSFITVTL